MSFRSSVRTVAVCVLAAGVAALISAGPASAHVTVSSATAVQGGYATLTLKVPTESATASTTGLKVQLPVDQPLASVSILPMPGWSYVVTKAKLTTPIDSHGTELTEAVSTVEWTADSAATAIKPGEFNQFVLSAGPLPSAPSMTFKALQTYSDQSVVSWIQEAAPGSTTTPDHPAPVLTLTAKQQNPAPVPSGTVAPTVSAVGASTSDSGTKATTAIVLGAVGIVLGALALGATLRRPRSASKA